MLQGPIARVAALLLSALFTLTMLVSIDHLAQTAEKGGAQWAQRTTPRA